MADRLYSAWRRWIGVLFGVTALAAAEPYRQERAVATTDGFERRSAQLEKDVSVPTAETYKEGIRMPNEIVGFHGGLSPDEKSAVRRAMRRARPAPASRI